MQELVYQHGINNYFNCNIEILRDIVEVIGLRAMSNANNNMSWAITNRGRISVMIYDDRKYGDEFKAVICEFQGDGCVSICKCDQHGNPIDENKYKLFDTHSYTSTNSNTAFRNILRVNFGVVY